MLGLARYAMKSPWNAGLLAAGFAALPLFYVVSAAIVALVALRHGVTAGTRALVWSFAGALVAWYTTGLLLPLLVLPITAGLALVLRQVQDWRLTLVFAAILGLALAMIGEWVLADHFRALTERLAPVRAMMDDSSASGRMLDSIQADPAYVILAGEMFEAILCLILARYWQAGLYNPGGFRAEFHALRYDGRLLVILVVLVTLAVLLKPVASLLLLLPLCFAGAALVHGLVAKAKLGGQWLVAFYLGGLLLNQFFLPLLVMASVTDGLFDYRARVKGPDRDDE